MRIVTLTRPQFDAFVRAYSAPPLPADEIALMVGYQIRLKLNAASVLPEISEQARRDLEATGTRAMRRLRDEQAEFSFAEEEYQHCLNRFAEGRKTLTGWAEEEVVGALMAFKNARSGDVPALVKEAAVG